MRCFARYYSDPRRPLLLGFTIRYFSPFALADITVTLIEAISDYRGISFQASLN